MNATDWSHNDQRALLDLRQLTFNCIVLRLFQANAASRADLKDASTVVRFHVRQLPLPKDQRERLWTSCAAVFADARRWLDKHGELFNECKPHRSQHLRLFLELLRWTPEMDVDDPASARCLIAANTDWPQLQFQFACAYALESTVSGFDPIRLRAFRRKLDEHPLYSFWFRYLHEDRRRLFDVPGLTPNQAVSLAFQWALRNGFDELTRFFWRKVTEPQREYMAMLQWRHVCMQARHGAMFAFLCAELCTVNASTVARTTAQIFLHSVQKAVEGGQTAAAKEPHVARIQFLLLYACPGLRRALFEAQNYRALLLALQRKNYKVLGLLRAAVPAQQLMAAVERLGIDFPAERATAARFVMAESRGPHRQWSMG